MNNLYVATRQRQILNKGRWKTGLLSAKLPQTPEESAIYRAALHSNMHSSPKRGFLFAQM